MLGRTALDCHQGDFSSLVFGLFFGGFHQIASNGQRFEAIGLPNFIQELGPGIFFGQPRNAFKASSECIAGFHQLVPLVLNFRQRRGPLAHQSFRLLFLVGDLLGSSIQLFGPAVQTAFNFTQFLLLSFRIGIK